jgi:hypothetical protein
MTGKTRGRIRFAVCLDNRGYGASLEVGKLYRVIPDEEASKHGYLRVVDESGQDYGYAAGRFFLLNIPQPIALGLSGGPATGKRIGPTGVASGTLRARRG